VVDRVDLYEWTTELLEAMRRAAQPDAPLAAGDHCTFCPAAPACPALQVKALEAAHTAFGPAGEIATPPDPASLPTDKIVAVLDAADMIEDWLNAVRAHARRLVEDGQTVGDYILVPKQARRKWAGDDDFVVTNLVEMGLERDDLFDQKLKSPAQMEKLVAPSARSALLGLVTKESNGTNLVRSDKTTRAAIPSPAQRAELAFGKTKD
jgi:hypothetical protein